MRAAAGPRSGSALIIALWALMALSLLVASFAFDMHVEAGIASHYRKRTKALYLARAGVEYARMLITRSTRETADEEIDMQPDPDLALAERRLRRGIGMRAFHHEMGGGFFTLDILPEESRRNVNLLEDEDWEEILDQGRVPESRWAELIDCFNDWVDEDDFQRLHGAESDDPFYRERGYPCKNARLDTVDELRLIKGFEEALVFGGPGEYEEDEPMPGIARWLTVWGDGKVNINSAGREVLLTLPGLDAFAVDRLIEGRKGFDGIAGTEDDGFESIEEAADWAALPEQVLPHLTVSNSRYWRVTVVGEFQGVRNQIQCVLRVEGRQVTPVFWREEALP